AEYALINDDIKADYLKVPHHGSKTSSTDLFLDKVKPEVASLGAKLGNHFGHPHKEILERFQKRGIRVYRTDKNGAVEIRY
ncbi:MBL fold metallo-hydrolase, partial [bacterium]|nr:MBL fold metallo-hydrolase [bacterium]